MCTPSISRRELLLASAGASCAAHLARTAAIAPWVGGLLRSRVLGRVVAHEPFGRLEAIAPGVWALISDPFGGDRTTLANGAIIAGTRDVMLVEGLYTPAGALWLRAQALALTGRLPTRVLLTHHHGDHVDGISAYMPLSSLTPRVACTTVIRDAVLTRATTDALQSRFSDIEVIPNSGEHDIDLGGVRVRAQSLQGHTASDVVVWHHDAKVVIGGDLLFNGIFPNYVDATPSALRRAVTQLQGRGKEWRYVPGHGAVMTDADLTQYIAMLDAVEGAARAAHGRGQSVADAAAAWSIPASLGEWRLFGPAFLPRAITAWYRELDAAR
jgi:glyoxylase-like metal-dependent hydrolase (beta-lactamase superfamily II)